MPYKSLKQEKWAHTPSGLAKLGKAKVAEFDQASKGLALPKKAKKPDLPTPGDMPDAKTKAKGKRK